MPSVTKYPSFPISGVPEARLKLSTQRWPAARWLAYFAGRGAVETEYAVVVVKGAPWSLSAEERLLISTISKSLVNVMPALGGDSLGSLPAIVARR